MNDNQRQAAIKFIEAKRHESACMLSCKLFGFSVYVSSMDDNIHIVWIEHGECGGVPLRTRNGRYITPDGNVHEYPKMKGLYNDIYTERLKFANSLTPIDL